MERIVHASERYQRHVAELRSAKTDDEAFSLAIGGEFIPFGRLLRDLVLQEGLAQGSSLIDIGCGSGRMPYALRDLSISYLGTDVVPDLLERAARICGRPEWTFQLASDLTIPAGDASSDMVTFFSVFTHLLHEETYAYLSEAFRVLRRGGLVIFSFLDFTQPHHWSIFADMVTHLKEHRPLNQFIDKQAIPIWAAHLGFEVQAIHDGSTEYIRLSSPVTLDDGREFRERASLGQSVAILRKPATAET